MAGDAAVGVPGGVGEVPAALRRADQERHDQRDHRVPELFPGEHGAQALGDLAGGAVTRLVSRGHCGDSRSRSRTR